MQQRKSAVGNGRPSGTDGSDFSYRMVVDSRYKKVAKGKSRLSSLMFTQPGEGALDLIVRFKRLTNYVFVGFLLIIAIVQLVGVLNLLRSIPKEESPNTLAASSTVISFISLLIGELGRRRSRVNLLKFYMFASSLAVLISVACVGRSNYLVEVIRDPSQWETYKFELLKIAGVLLGLLVQIFTISTTISLIHNMSPAKRAS